MLTNFIWREMETLYPEIWHGLHYSAEWVSIPGEEGNEAFERRLVAVLAEIQAQHGDQETVAIIPHGASLGTIPCHLLGLDTGRSPPFHFGNTSLSIVEFHTRGPVLTLLNDTCHLDGYLQ